MDLCECDHSEEWHTGENGECEFMLVYDDYERQCECDAYHEPEATPCP